ncbi:ALF repeat-containing protein [Streptomyces marokkonensis]|uniref:ALF repeat-containing protein n=1 Tax=Streptomyces marokkonensis TaxID=324855 RepID=UPI001AD6AB79|nr:ALF repeat-containing protein [Streptomyces marokkonensis]
MPLPDTERAKVVRAWLTAGKGVKAAAEALYGSDAGIQAFLAETPGHRRRPVRADVLVAGDRPARPLPGHRRRGGTLSRP